MNTKHTPTPMTACQRLVLRELSSYVLFPGYCELMMDTGLKSYKAVDWVLDALERRALVRAMHTAITSSRMLAAPPSSPPVKAR